MFFHEFVNCLWEEYFNQKDNRVGKLEDLLMRSEVLDKLDYLWNCNFRVCHEDLLQVVESESNSFSNCLSSVSTEEDVSVNNLNQELKGQGC